MKEITIVAIRDLIRRVEKELKNSIATIMVGSKGGIEVVSAYTFYAPKIKEWKEKERKLSLTDVKEREWDKEKVL